MVHFPGRCLGESTAAHASYKRLKGLRFISGLLGLMGSANKSSSVASSPPPPFAFAAGMPLPTMASNEARPPLPESFPTIRFPRPGSAEAFGGRFVARGCVRGWALFEADG